MQGVKSDKVAGNVVGNENEIVQKSEARSLQWLYLECSLINPRVVLLPLSSSFALFFFLLVLTMFSSFSFSLALTQTLKYQKAHLPSSFLFLPALLKNLYLPFVSHQYPSIFSFQSKPLPALLSSSFSKTSSFQPSLSSFSDVPRSAKKSLSTTTMARWSRPCHTSQQLAPPRSHPPLPNKMSNSFRVAKEGSTQHF